MESSAFPLGIALAVNKVCNWTVGNERTKRMKITIISHSVIREGESPETYRFGFTIEGGDVAPRSDYISVRTAHVLTRELQDGTPFMAMLFAIVNADPSEYQSLVGQIFTH
jgi:hypothetical protein